MTTLTRIVSSADAETIAVTNDVDAMDDSKGDVAGGGDVALASDAASVAAGKNNEIYGAEYKNSSSQLLGASDENNVLENENDGEILKETSATRYVDANAAASGDGKSEATAFQNLKNALFLRGFIYSCFLQFVYFYWINFFDSMLDIVYLFSN